MSQRIRLGELLVRGGLLTEAQLAEVLESQRASGRRLGEEIVARGLVDETQVTQMISNQLSVPWVSLYKVPFTRELLSLVPAEIADRHNLIPVYVRKVRRQGDTLFVALDDPEDSAALGLVAQITGMPVKPMVSPLSEIRNAIRVYYFGLPPQTATTSSGELEAVSSAEEERPSAPDAEEAPVAAPAVEAVRPSAPDVAAEPVAAAPPREARAEAPPETAAPRRAPKSGGPKFVTMTLLDGTTVRLPVSSGPSPDGETRADERLTARDLVKALDARALGENTADVLGDASWEALFSTLLSILLRKGLVADWEFVEEWQKHRPGSR
jgi:type IV pilus assembly protein PilB